MRVRRVLATGFLVATALGLTTSPAAATFHEMSIREVYPGSVAEPAAEYVELQMWSAGQNLVGGHTLRIYAANGAPTPSVLPADVSHGANQSTILLATPEAAALIPGAADAALSSSGQLDPAGGAVCWETIDCVSWGSFKGAPTSPAGSPAVAIPDGMALRRTISPGCATLLEPTDDHDNSATDLSAVFPAPRPNSIAPSERACAENGSPQGGPGGNGPEGNRKAPQTSLRRKPPRMTHDSTPTFRFSSNEAGSNFQCKLDAKPFRPCRSPFNTATLSPRRHTFKVRARDDSGRLDSSPAAYSFRVLPKGG